MKKYIIGVVTLLVTFNLNAQRVVEKQLTVTPTTNLELNLDFADTIHIVQSKDNSIRIKAIVNINNNLHNDKYELIADEGGQTLRISAKVHDMKSIRIPCENHKGSSYEYHDGECLTMDINYEIEVPVLADIKVETISGDIIINLRTCPMTLKSISGFVDLSIPTTSNSDISISTITGGVYSNHDISKEKNSCDSNPAGTRVNFRLNSGGSRIKLNTISGDIFLREI
jgi:hypothetical protein